MRSLWSLAGIRRTLPALPAACLLLAAACVSSRFAAVAVRGPGNAAEREFDRRARAFLDDFLRANPVFATANGYHAHDGRFEDFSPAAVASGVESLRRHRDEIAGVNVRELPLWSAVDRAIVLGAIDKALFQLVKLRRHERDPTLYNEIAGFGTLHLIPGTGGPGDEARLAALAERMERLPGFLETARRNLRDPPAVFTSFGAEQARGAIDLYEKDVAAVVGNAPPDLRERLTSARANAVRALRDWHDWLVRDLLPRSDGDWRVGAGPWKTMLSTALGSEVRPADLVASAREDLARRRTAMLSAAAPVHARLFPDHRHFETGERLANAVTAEVLFEVSRRRTPSASPVAEMARQVASLRKFVGDAGIVEIPPEDGALVIETAPAFIGGMAVASFGLRPAGDGRGRPSLWIRATPLSPADGRSRAPDECSLQAIAIHEAYPGHYVQWWHAMKSNAGSVWRRVFQSAAFSEGWATFAEDLVISQGFGPGDAECRLVHQRAGLDAALDVIIDERFHSRRDDDAALDAWAMEFLVHGGFQDEAAARQKILRAKLTAAQLSTYFAGRTVFEESLRDWKARTGARFGIREFSDTVLSFGAVPPAELKRILPAD